jgi:hypothetical protein
MGPLSEIWPSLALAGRVILALLIGAVVALEAWLSVRYWGAGQSTFGPLWLFYEIPILFHLVLGVVVVLLVWGQRHHSFGDSASGQPVAFLWAAIGLGFLHFTGWAGQDVLAAAVGALWAVVALVIGLFVGNRVAGKR